MAKQVMVMMVIEDDWDLDELQRTVNDVLVFKHDIAVIVEDTCVTQENYDWKTANGIVEENEDGEPS